MRNKILAFLIATVMVITLFPAAAFTATGDVHYGTALAGDKVELMGGTPQWVFFKQGNPPSNGIAAIWTFEELNDTEKQAVFSEVKSKDNSISNVTISDVYFFYGDQIITNNNSNTGQYQVIKEGNKWYVYVISGSLSHFYYSEGDILGYLKIVKHWDGYPDGFDDFPESISGTITHPDGTTIDDFTLYAADGWEDTFGPYIPGEYTVAEDDIDGWDTTLDPIDGKVDVVAGEEADAVVLDIYNDYIPQYHDETMWAYHDGYAIRFTEIAKNLKNWGWTNGPFDVDEGEIIELDLYAGAGGNDISKGQLVGTVTITFNGDGKVTVEYETDHEMLEVHFFIGRGEDNKLPKAKNKYTNAPGQFPYDESDGDMSSDGMYFEMTIPFEFLEDIYIAAHGVVRIYE